MKVNVSMDLLKIAKLSAAQQKAGKMVAEQMIHEIVTEQRMPFDEGTLQNIQTSVEVKDKVIQIVHDTPYATNLYFNPQFNFDRTINSKAGGEWWEDYINGSKKKRPAQLFAKFYKQIGGL